MQTKNVVKPLLIFTLCFYSMFGWAASGPSVVFLNPGEPTDRGKGMFWVYTAQVMEVAANNFGFDLEILYSERDHLLMLSQAKSVAKRATLPDYVILTNAKLLGPRLMEVFANTSVKILLIHNDLTTEQRRKYGNEREHFSNWIGTITTNEESGVSRMMDELYRQLGDREPQIIGITGDRSAPVALERALGVEDFVSKSERGEILQLTYSNWAVEEARKKTEVLLSRYPQTNIIWAANYAMAQGALQAVKERGVNVLIGCVSVAPYLKTKMENQGISVSMGSHFFIGAWGMVLLHDFHNGEDFSQHGGIRLKSDYLHVINSDNAPTYFHTINDNIDKLDFSPYSQFISPNPHGYSFSLAPFLGTN
ncbi:ABC transporter substrate-binding protein [Vibrio sp. WJH972]